MQIQSPNEQEAMITWDHHTCEVDPDTDRGMWHKYVQRIFEKHSPNDWETLSKEGDETHEMTCFVKSFTIHVLKISEQQIKKTALKYQTSDTHLKVDTVQNIHSGIFV
jgi:hypothetical protein